MTKARKRWCFFLFFFYLQTGCFVLFGYYYYFFFCKSINQPSYISRINSRYIINNSAHAHWFLPVERKKYIYIYIYMIHKKTRSAPYRQGSRVSAAQKEKKKKKMGKREVKTWKKLICVWKRFYFCSRSNSQKYKVEQQQ